VFKADLPIREAQLVQTAVGQVLVRVVPAPGYGPATEEAIRDALRARLGETDTTFDRVDRIAREANGKFRMAVSLVQEAGDELRK
jgi:phenylacetate-CoA ligase